jgi:hypothetical protein
MWGMSDSDKKIDGTSTDAVSVATVTSGAVGDVAGATDTASRERDDTTNTGVAGGPHDVSHNATKAVSEETSIGETPGHTSRIVGG